MANVWKANITNKVKTNLNGSESNEDLILDLLFDQKLKKSLLCEVVPQLITKF